MNTTIQLAKHIRDVYFGGNWTCVNMKDTLADVTWQQATTKVQSFNSIATLVFHTSYYIGVVTRVLQGGALEGKDELSFAHPPILSQADWENMLNKTWAEVEVFAKLTEQLPENMLWENFTDPKYGTYYRNLLGFTEHTHYHLGQITLIKKLLTDKSQIE